MIINMKKITAALLAVILTAGLVMGCSRVQAEEEDNNATSDNIIITETGEVIEKPVEKEPILEEQEAAKKEAEPTQEPQTLPIELDIPEQEQVITQEDQTEPQGYGLQLVFLGDSIFDNNRDGTGIPYLTAVQCEADVFNLAIGGTSASVGRNEETDIDKWNSIGFCGVVYAMKGDISTDIFEGTRAKELLDNKNIDFSQTDYFIVEYGTNDFFQGTIRADDGDGFDKRTYEGALRWGVSQLKEIAPDATIILCSPCYAQFYKDGYLVGDGNMTDLGFGTLFDYKGTCNYIANEQNCLFLNAYQDLGVDGYTIDKYMEDGLHFSEEGRKLYADALARIILNYETTKNN